MKRYHWSVVGLVALLFALSGARSLFSLGRATPVMTDIVSLPVIVIDPGHGGPDGGAVGVDDIVEKDINLSVSEKLRDMFRVCGFEVVMTRDSDRSIHDEGITGARKQKTSDLHNRLAIAEEHPNALFLSIHQNKFGDSRSWGTQIFFGPENPQSEQLATVLQDNFRVRLQPENERVQKKAGKNLYLMYNATCPSVLVECGFLSNREEAAKLVDQDYQSRVAFVVFVSVMEYLELDQPALPPEPAALENEESVQ